MKKIIVITVITLSILAGCSSHSTIQEAEPTTITEASTETETATKVISEETAALQDSLEQYGIKDPRTVRNDKGGNYRIQMVATGTPTSDYAVDYANAYMLSGTAEVHYIVNLSLETTTVINRISSDEIEVRTYEYVEDEEHDAATLGTGMMLSDTFYNTETGEEIAQ